MEVAITVTNQGLYEERVKSLELNNLKAESSEIFHGAIQVFTKDDKIVPFFGLIEAKDFESRFGFILTLEKVSTFSF